jgi:hypothetical protein
MLTTAQAAVLLLGSPGEVTQLAGTSRLPVHGRPQTAYRIRLSDSRPVSDAVATNARPVCDDAGQSNAVPRGCPLAAAKAQVRHG